MATTTVSDAAVFPQAKGTGLASETSPVDAAGEGLLSQYHGKEYHTLSVSSRDGTNNTITLSAGIAFIEDDSSSTGGSRGTGGNPQLQSTTSSGYDTETPENPVYVVVLPTTNTIDVADASTSQIWLNITSVTSQNSVELRSDGGGGTTAEPSDTYLKIGDFNPDDSSADSIANTDRGQDTIQANADGLIVYVGDTTGRQTLDPANSSTPIRDAVEAIYANSEGGAVYPPCGNIDHDAGDGNKILMRPGISVWGQGADQTETGTQITRTSAGDLFEWNGDSNQSVGTRYSHLAGVYIDGDYKNLGNAIGRALVFDDQGATATRQCWIRDICIRKFGDSAIGMDGNTYACTFGPNIRADTIDPENAASNRPILDFNTDGVGNAIIGYNEVYGTPSPVTSGDNCLGLESNGGLSIDRLAFGGSVDQPINIQGLSFSADYLYWEPDLNGTPGAIPWAIQIDQNDPKGSRHIQTFSIGGTVTLTNVYRFTSFGTGDPQTTYIPKMAIRGTGNVTVNDEQVELDSDVGDQSVVYGGPSSEVDNDSGSELTNPVVCQGDGVYKASTGVGYTASVDRKSGVPGLLVASNAALTLSSGSAIIATGVTTTPAHFDVHLDPSGNGTNAADVKCSARAFWDNTAGEYKIEVLEDGTSVGNPDIGVEVYQTA